jgi:CRP-like cAMP-binding protein
MKGMLGIASYGDLTSLETMVNRADAMGITRRRYAAGTIISGPDAKVGNASIVASGWAVCAKVLPNGTRTVIDFALKGDLVWSDLCDLTQETVTALTDAIVYELPMRALRGPGANETMLQAVMTRVTARYARVAERLAGIARHDALGRTGHLLLELDHRSGPPQRRQLNGFECPLTQADIGDTLGLSTVHVNRVLRDMRLQGLLSFRNGVVEFLDRERLVAITGFEQDYLAGGV